MRLGGHTKGASYRSFLGNEHNFGLEDACRIAKLECNNIKSTHAFAFEHGIECDAHPCPTVDIIYDQEQWNGSVMAIKRMNEVLEGAERYNIISAEEAAKKYLTPGALGAFEYEAGSISAYRFVIGILKSALDKGLNLQTNTLVKSVERRFRRKDGEWTVSTERGNMSAKNVVVATNGYTAKIIPVFQGIIVPLRGQITAQRPGTGLPSEGLPATYTFIYGEGYEYMITRPPGTKFEGDIIIGGGWATLQGGGAREFGLTDDSVLRPEISKYLHDITATYFGDNWGEDHPDGRVRKEWTGIMGTSADGLPYVGLMPGQDGLWVSVSFDGHGMALCLKCAEALTTMMVGNDEEVTALNGWFPEAFKVTQARLKMVFTGRINIKAPDETVETRSHI